MKHNDKHSFHFMQNGGLIQAKITTIDDVLNLRDLDPKMWTALACPVKGLEFSEETLSVLDTDKNGRVRIPEILDAVEYIRKYFAKPEIIMEKGDSIPLDALSDEPFPCGHSPLVSAKSVLEILEKPDASEIHLEDLSVNDKLFAPNVLNGDGVLPPECVGDEAVAAVVKDIIACTGGSDDISGAKGITRAQLEEFCTNAKALKEWREAGAKDDPKIFFLKEATDAAAKSFMAVKDKINDYYLRCSLISYDASSKEIFKAKTDTMFLDENGDLYDLEHLALLPLAMCEAGKPLPFDGTLNPAWREQMQSFKENVIKHLFEKDIASLSEGNWRKIEEFFKPYENWYKAMPENEVSGLGLDRINEILSGGYDQKIAALLDEEESRPPIALASVELKKMLLLRRDFLELLKNFVSFEEFYTLGEMAIFQCGTLYLDGRSCDLCLKVLDIAKHGTMAALSQCFLVYCDCTKRGSNSEKMQIAALISNGNTDNIIVGRNGMFYDRQGNDWDATIVKIIENPVNIKQAFFSPYKKLLRFIQEKIAKATAEKEAASFDKMTKAVNDPKAVAEGLAGAKKTDIGTVAAISVAFTGIAAVVGGILEAFFKLGAWIPLGIAGIVLAISLPSMILAYLKLRQRNIAPILDASGWAINGNTKISTVLGGSLTHLPVRPVGSFLSGKDPFAVKKFPWKRLLFALILIAVIVLALVLILRNPAGISGVWESINGLLSKFKVSS
ncbi:MAG: hypothetical protein J5597_06290 [Spirochaetaceae bacterium]|nr:hypothetical protein [Spirochaetaceae bacterium]